MQETKNDPLGEQLDLLWRVMRGNAQGLAAVRLFLTVLQTLAGDDEAGNAMHSLFQTVAQAEQGLVQAHDDVVRLIKQAGCGQPEAVRVRARQAAILRKIAAESGEGTVAFAESAPDNGVVVIETGISDTLPPPKPKPGR